MRGLRGWCYPCGPGSPAASAPRKDTGDATQVEPTLAGIGRAQKIVAAGHEAGGHSPALSVIGTVVYDAGYFSQKNCEAEGPDRLIAPGSWTSAESTCPHTPGQQPDAAPPKAPPPSLTGTRPPLSTAPHRMSPGQSGMPGTGLSRRAGPGSGRPQHPEPAARAAIKDPQPAAGPAQPITSSAAAKVLQHPL